MTEKPNVVKPARVKVDHPRIIRVSATWAHFTGIANKERGKHENGTTVTQKIAGKDWVSDAHVSSDDFMDCNVDVER